MRGRPLIVAALLALSLALAGVLDVGHVHSDLDAGLECYGCHLSADPGASDTTPVPATVQGPALIHVVYVETADSQPAPFAYPRGPPILS